MGWECGLSVGKERKLRNSQIVWRSKYHGVHDSTESTLVGSRDENERVDDVQEGARCHVFGNEKEGSSKKKIDGGR